MTTGLLALGLVLYPSTALRFGGMPIGPGEILLLTWMFLTLADLLLSRQIVLNPALRHVLAFWTVLTVVLCIGMIAGLLHEPYQFVSGMVHDTAAYILMAALGCLMAIDLADPRRRRDVVWLVVFFGTVSTLLQIVSSTGLFTIPGTDPLYFDRLRGWSLDPNQLGFLAVFLVLLSLHLAETAPTTWASLAAFACAVPPIAAGVLTKSDTFVLATILAAVPFLTLKSISWIADADLAPTMRGGAVVLAVLAAPVGVIAAIPVLVSSSQQIEQGLMDVYEEDGQGDMRLHLWKEAITVGIESGFIGFGPGPHLTSKSYKRPPPAKFESHNTPLEIFTQGGLLGTLAFMRICAATLVRTTRARLPALAGLVMAAILFSLFHFVLRHPLFWFGIVFCLLEAVRSAGAATAAGQPIARIFGQPRKELQP